MTNKNNESIKFPLQHQPQLIIASFAPDREAAKTRVALCKVYAKTVTSTHVSGTLAGVRVWMSVAERG